MSTQPTIDYRSLIETITPRRTGEGVWLYLQRAERGASLLRQAAATPGNPLHNYLTRLAPFTPPADRADALRTAARKALQQCLLAEAA